MKCSYTPCYSENLCILQFFEDLKFEPPKKANQMFFRPENLTPDSRTSIGTKIICHIFCFKDHITLHLMMPRIPTGFWVTSFARCFFRCWKNTSYGSIFSALGSIGSVKTPEVSHHVLPLKIDDDIGIRPARLELRGCWRTRPQDPAHIMDVCVFFFCLVVWFLALRNCGKWWKWIDLRILVQIGGKQHTT